jgi:PAS domain S-box-containing protein
VTGVFDDPAVPQIVVTVGTERSPLDDPLCDLAGVDSRFEVMATDRAGLVAVESDCVLLDDPADLEGWLAAARAADTDVPVFLYRPTRGQSATVAGVAGTVTAPELHEAVVGDPTALVARLVDAVAARWVPDDLTLRNAALDAVSTGVTVSDPTRPDNPLVYVNDHFVRMTGYERHEALGRNCRFLQGPDTDPEPVGELRRAVETGRPAFVELKNYDRNGGAFWNQLQVLPIHDDDGVLRYFLGIQRDVTERRRRADRADRLAEAGRRLDAVVRDTADAPPASVETLLELGRDGLAVSNAHLTAVDRTAGVGEVVRSVGAPLVAMGAPADLGATYCRRAVESLTPTAFRDGDRAHPDDDPGYRQTGFGCYLALPVHVDGALYGAVCFADEDSRTAAFGAGERQFAARLADRLGVELARRDTAPSAGSG